jgi:hypothetical protein
MSERATMTEIETEPMESTDTAVEPAKLSARIRNSLALAQTRLEAVESRARTQWGELPQQMRAALDRVLDRVRTTLDVPSRSEVGDLLARIEELDRKLGALQTSTKAARADEIRRRAEGGDGGGGKKTTANKVSRKPRPKPKAK